MFLLEATRDQVCISMTDDYHGKMLRSIDAGVSGLTGSAPKADMRMFWVGYAVLVDEQKRLVEETAKASRDAMPKADAAS